MGNEDDYLTKSYAMSTSKSGGGHALDRPNKKPSLQSRLQNGKNKTSSVLLLHLLSFCLINHHHYFARNLFQAWPCKSASWTKPRRTRRAPARTVRRVRNCRNPCPRPRRSIIPRPARLRLRSVPLHSRIDPAGCRWRAAAAAVGGLPRPLTRTVNVTECAISMLHGYVAMITR